MKPLLLLPFISLALFFAFPLNGLPQVLLAQGSASPTAAFTYFPCVPCAVPGDLVVFYGNWSIASATNILSYTWSFGDGSPVVSTNDSVISHDYFGIPSHWSVKLTVRDANGFSDSIIQEVLFFVYPQFDLRPLKAFVGYPVEFNASASISYQTNNTITGYDWNFGDGTNTSGVVVTHSYSLPGTYRVLSTLRTPSGDPSISKTILVESQESAGGQIIPPDQMSLILPYVTLATVIAAVTVIFSYLRKKTKLPLTAFLSQSQTAIGDYAFVPQKGTESDLSRAD